MNKTISKKNFIILGVILVAFPFVADKLFNWNYGVLLANFAILYIIAVSGLDILFGYSGQISMGHAAFYCIGAYGSDVYKRQPGRSSTRPTPCWAVR